MKSILKNIVVYILSAEAKIIIRKYKPTIIAVTGSVGKTSTKDAIYTLLAPHTHVRKSEKSFNSEIGVPLTVLGCQNAWSDPVAWMNNILFGLDLILNKHEYPKCLVLEVGADHPGDIKKLTSWLKPDIAVITAVSKVPVHVEFFSSPKDVLKEKLELARAIKPTGTLVLPANDIDILAVRHETPELEKIPCVTFAVDSIADVSISNYAISYVNNEQSQSSPKGMTFKIESEGVSNESHIDGIIGKQSLFSICAALATSKAFGVPVASLIPSVSTHKGPRGRMNLIPGLNNSTLIDDTYNASPDAVLEALNVLNEVTSSSRKIAALGDMMELGQYSLEQHKKIGEKVAQIFVQNKNATDLLITVGIRARDIAVGAHEAGLDLKQIVSFDASLEVGEYMKTIVSQGDIILIKGSQSSRMERVSKALLAESVLGQSAELLVRQDTEWLQR